MRDVGIVYAMNETFGTHIALPDSAVTLVAKIKNLGQTPEGNFNVTAWVTDSAGAFVFADTIFIETIPQGASKTLIFEPDFFPPVVGQYKLEFRNYLRDWNPSNDRITSELRVVQYHGLGTETEILYDDRELEERLVWQGDSSGLANAFEIPFTAFKVERVRIPLEVSATSRDLEVWLLNADSLGNPAQILAADTISVSYGPELQWAVSDFSDAGIMINRGKVFAAVVVQKSDSLLLGGDYVFLQATSRRGWEYVDGEFAPHRERELYDLGIHLVVSWQEVSEVEPEVPAFALPSVISLFNYPNPFNSVTKISYDLPTAGDLSLKVYDVSGRLVETLVNGRQDAGSYTVDWDASGISSGIYFYKLTTADRHCARKMVVLR